MAEDRLFSGESVNVEYKVEVPKKSENYMKTVVAFANGRGGRLVFGVDDKTLEIVGKSRASRRRSRRSLMTLSVCVLVVGAICSVFSEFLGANLAFYGKAAKFLYGDKAFAIFISYFCCQLRCKQKCCAHKTRLTNQTTQN